MRKDLCTAGMLLFAALLAFCLPLSAHAEAEEAVIVSGISLAEAAANAPEAAAFVISGQVDAGGLVLNPGVTVTVPADARLFGRLYLNGGTLDGKGDVKDLIRYVRIPANVTKIVGGDAENAGGWMTEDQVLYVLLNNEPYFYRLTGGVPEGPLHNAIAYVGPRDELLPLEGLPSFYYVMDVDQTIPEGPEIDGAVFGYWSGDLGEGRTLTIPAGTNQDLVIRWNPASGQGEDPAGGSGGIPNGFGGHAGGGSGGAPSGGGSVHSFPGRSGGSSGNGSASSSGGTEAPDSGASGKSSSSGSSGASPESSASLSNVYASTTGNVRTRRASSNTRRTITDDGGYAEAKRTAAEKAKDAFPWKTDGIAAGGAAALLLMICLRSRRAKAKRKAMYEKLRIRDD